MPARVSSESAARLAALSAARLQPSMRSNCRHTTRIQPFREPDFGSGWRQHHPGQQPSMCQYGHDSLSTPPPQLVVQIQNAHGTNRSPLVAGVRNLADSEFWDFNSIDGSRKYPTRGFVEVATNDQLWNAFGVATVERKNRRSTSKPDPTRLETLLHVKRSPHDGEQYW